MLGGVTVPACGCVGVCCVVSWRGGRWKGKEKEEDEEEEESNFLVYYFICAFSLSSLDRRGRKGEERENSESQRTRTRRQESIPSRLTHGMRDRRI